MALSTILALLVIMSAQTIGYQQLKVMGVGCGAAVTCSCRYDFRFRLNVACVVRAGVWPKFEAVESALHEIRVGGKLTSVPAESLAGVTTRSLHLSDLGLVNMHELSLRAVLGLEELYLDRNRLKVIAVPTDYE